MGKIKFCCPHCNADFEAEGVGHDSHCYQVEFRDGSWTEPEYGDLIENYCPVCGHKIPDKLYEDINKAWFNGDD